MHWRQVEHPSPSLAVGMPKAQTGASLFESGDGVWLHLMGEPTKSPRFREAMEQVRPEGQRDDPTVLFGMFDGWADALMLHPSSEWLETFWANDVPVQPALAPGEIFTNEQALVNHYVVEVDHPELGHIAMAGSPITVDPPTRVRDLAPALGEHTREVLDEWKPRERTPGATTTAAEVRWPLEGVKVVDAGGFLAGPLGPMMLADLGADVVKVEATTGEGMRNVEWAFFGCQRGKRDVALDLKAPSARPAVEALLAQADILHHNVRMPAAHRLGLDEASVRAVNPDIIYCHTSSYGPVGARADWPGYDQLFQASCGWEVAGAGEGNPPMWHRFGFMDHLCAMGSVIATLLALYHRDRTGQTQFAAGSLLGGGVLTGSETYLDPSGKTAPDAGARPRADRCLTRLPHPAGDRRLDRDRRDHRRRARRAVRGGRGRRRGRRGRRARRAHERRCTRRTHLRACAVRSGAARPVRLVLRIRRQRCRRDDRPLPAHRLRRRRSSPARSGPSAISTSGSTARRPDSASTPSRC